jgi:hypothetical protein
MAHFAEIDASGIVIRVIVIPDAEENNGAEWCAALFGGQWLQTSYTGRIRKNFAGVGFTYDAVRDAFIPPQPFPSWVLDDATCQWQSPIPPPESGIYYWNEDVQNWAVSEDN